MASHLIIPLSEDHCRRSRIIAEERHEAHRLKEHKEKCPESGWTHDEIRRVARELAEKRILRS